MINRFSAATSSFRAEFARSGAPRRKVNLTVSTVLSNEIEPTETKWLESLLEIWHQGAMVFDLKGKVVQATEFTDKMLEKYFPQSKADKNGLPRELSNWMKVYKLDPKNHDGVLLTQEPFQVKNDGDELLIRLIVDNRARTKTLLLKETIQMKPEGLKEPFGLTKREAEVLFLITKGKTNPEIGILLDISKRTVQKHVEHIYTKLGVETRTAAMLRVNELNSDLDSEVLGSVEIE